MTHNIPRYKGHPYSAIETKLMLWYLLEIYPISNKQMPSKDCSSAILKVYSKTCVKWPLSKRPNMVFNTHYHLMQVKSIAECTILSTVIKLPVVIKIFVLSI